MATARIIRAGFHIIPRCYIRLRRRKRCVDLVSGGKPGVANSKGVFCGETRDVFGVEVYRNTAAVLVLGKSEGKGAAARRADSL